MDLGRRSAGEGNDIKAMEDGTTTRSQVKNGGGMKVQIWPLSRHGHARGKSWKGAGSGHRA